MLRESRVSGTPPEPSVVVGRVKITWLLFGFWYKVEKPASFHGDWNYCVLPQSRKTYQLILAKVPYREVALFGITFGEEVIQTALPFLVARLGARLAATRTTTQKGVAPHARRRKAPLVEPDRMRYPLSWRLPYWVAASPGSSIG